MPHTPFFPQLRSRLAALGQRVQHLRQQSLSQLETLLEPLIPGWLLSQAEEGDNSRERIYTVRRTFFGFLGQVLKPQTSCREVVRQIQALVALHGGPKVDARTGAYCQARLRLPLDTLQRLRCALAARAQKILPQAQQLWRGHDVKALDGTTSSLPDTQKNQRAYPQPGGQKPGCGFPLLKLVGLFSLATGTLLGYAKGNKHRHELSLLQKLLDHFQPGDVALADRGFSCYALLALLLLRGVQSVFRLHHARRVDWRRGRRLGKKDRLVLWRKPQQKPRWLPQCAWKLIPKELQVRVVQFELRIPGFRAQSVVLVTTLLDAQAYPAEELARLYARRWRIELWFRDIKTSLGMEVLRCQSPKMVHKELEMFLIAYNVIRCLMAEAAALHDLPLERLSFKGTVDATRQFSIAIAQARSKKMQKKLLARLLETIASDPVPDRPGRREPRAVKRRPKPFPLLNQPRDQFQEIPHRNRYWKNNPRKSNA